MNTTNNDRDLRKLIKEMPLQKPGSGFSDRVMQAVLAEAANKAPLKTEPILGINFWIITGAFLLLMILFISMSGSGNTGEPSVTAGLLERFPSPGLDGIKEIYNRFWQSLSGIPLTLAVIMASASILIFADRFFSRRTLAAAG